MATKYWQLKQPKTYYDVKNSLNGPWRIIVNQGGSRSGKTYSTLQVLCEFCLRNFGRGYVISIVRKTTPSLKATAYRDFLEILHNAGWYNEANHNKSEMTYMLAGNMIEFFSLDDQQKVRGRKRDILFVNEANELSQPEFFQLNIRTVYKIILDFNPSDEFLWIYDLVETRRNQQTGKTDTILHVSNYRHNPHLNEELVTEIELLERADPDYWKVFGLGERGASKELILTHWREVAELPGLGTVVYGQDFGFNNPSALVKVEIWDDAVYVQQMIYESKLVTSDLADRYTALGLTYSDYIYCDSAAAESIEELGRFGFDAIKANKDVKEGLLKLKSRPLYITADSFALKKELRNYKWAVDKAGIVTDVPVKFNDHAVDALRYAVLSHEAKPKRMRSFSAN